MNMKIATAIVALWAFVIGAAITITGIIRWIAYLISA